MILASEIALTIEEFCIRCDFPLFEGDMRYRKGIPPYQMSLCCDCNDLLYGRGDKGFNE